MKEQMPDIGIDALNRFLRLGIFSLQRGMFNTYTLLYE